MIVHMAGDDTPQAFPVQFLKHSYGHMSYDNMTGKPSVDLYEASLDFRMSRDSQGNEVGLVMCPLDGSAVPGDEYFTFSGAISVDGSGIASGTREDAYTNDIADGQAVWHQAQVSGKSLSVDLKWQNSTDDLQLMIYTPDGYVLGPYGDASDGKGDGRVNLEISDHGDVADGTWSFKVMGVDVAGKDEYYLRTW